VILDPERLPDGRLLIPATARADDGTVGCGGRIPIGPDDPDFAYWSTQIPDDDPNN
jgi:hypothetical protein